MTDRNIQDGNYCWLEKGALQKIETIPYRQQASCKLVYLALCSLSAKKKNTPKISGWKSQIASFASVSDKTVQRSLPLLRSLGIIDYSPQVRQSNGKYDKVNIWLTANKVTDGLGRDSTETAQGTNCPIYKERNKQKKKSKYGEFVMLTDKEYQTLSEQHGKTKLNSTIEDMNNWVPNNRKYKDYAAALRNWLKKDEGSAKISGFVDSTELPTVI